jgi:FkbM family methyltransferase
LLALLRLVSRVFRVYKPRGAERLLRFIYPPDIRYQHRLEGVVQYDEQLRMHIDTSSHIEADVFFYGYYEPEMARLIKRLVRPGCVAVDVGANIGTHALLMGWQAGSTGHVLAIEPHPSIFRRLVANIRLNRLSHIQPYQMALAEWAGQSVLYAKPETFPNQGMANMYLGDWEPTNWVEIPIIVQTLDELVKAAGCPRVDLIKIDTEGNEYQVLLGGQETICTYRPYVLFEYADWTWGKFGVAFETCRAFLDAQGYSLYVVHAHRLARLGQVVPPSANMLAVPPHREVARSKSVMGR